MYFHPHFAEKQRSGGNAAELSAYISSLGGLEVYWPMNEESGNMINQAPDTIGQHDGTVTGATQGVEGQSGDSYSFDGVNDIVDIGTALNPVSGNTSLTIVGFMYLDSAGAATNRTIVAKRDSFGSTSMMWQLSINTSNQIFFGRSGITSYTSISTPPTNRWLAIAVRNDFASNTLRVFINGVVYTSTTTTFLSYGSKADAKVAVGCTYTSGGSAIADPMKGKLQHIAIFDEALTDNQIITISKTAGLT